MIQCDACEHFVRGPAGQVSFMCDPFRNIKEPECIAKWQLIKLDMMVRAYQATAEIYRKFAPLQEKIFKHMKREIEDLDEADQWKTSLDEEDELE